MPTLAGFFILPVLLTASLTPDGSAATRLPLPSSAYAYDSAAYAEIDAKASLAPTHSCKSVSELGDYLAGLSSDPTLKARAIYAWIIANIRYERLVGTTQVMQDADTVLHRRVAVCAGYSRLFKALAQAAGLEAVTITGDAKYGYGETRGRHAWNAVRIGERWGLVDCTWGCGFLDPTGQLVEGAPDLHFLAPPEMMIEGHFPEEPSWQLLDPPLSREEFDRRIYLNPTYYELGLSRIDQRYQIITAKGSARVTLEVPDGICINSVLYNTVRDLPNQTIAQREGGKYVVTAHFPAPGRYTLRLRAWRADDPHKIARRLLDYTVIATGANAAGFPTLWPDFHQQHAHLEAPRTHSVPVGEEVFFDITVPGAADVGVALTDDDDLQPLAGESGRFQGSATLSRPGTAAIWARFPGGRKHRGLVTYEAVTEMPRDELGPSAATVTGPAVSHESRSARLREGLGSSLAAGQCAGPVTLADLVPYQPGSVVSRSLIDGGDGSVTVLSLDRGTRFAERTLTGPVLIEVIEGEAEVTAGDSTYTVRSGDAMLVPANVAHSVRARTAVKMLSVAMAVDE